MAGHMTSRSCRRRNGPSSNDSSPGWRKRTVAVDPLRLRKLRVGQDGLRLSDRERLELVGMAIREYGVTLAGVVTGEETLLDPTGAAAEQIYRRGRLRVLLGVNPRK